MSIHDPNFVSTRFASASAGYLTTPAAELVLMRAALPNATVMVHQPSGGYQGQATDILIHAKWTEALKRRLNEIYEKHTGRSYDEIEKALDRDNFLTAPEAKAFGIIDQVFEKRAIPEAT